MATNQRKWRAIEAFEHFGASTKDQYAWSAQSPDRSVTVLTLWEDQISDDGVNVIADTMGHPTLDLWIESRQNKRRIQHLRDVRAGSRQFRVIMLRAAVAAGAPRRTAARWPEDYLIMTLTDFDADTGEFRAVGQRTTDGSKDLKYAPIGAWLRESKDDEVRLSLSRIEQLVGSLPKDARTPQFWANTKHQLSRRSQWLDNGYEAYFEPKADAVRFKRMVTSGSEWTTDELRACVSAYRKLWDAQKAGQRINKAEMRRQVIREALTARSEGAYERRMQNISAVIEELGMPFVEGYVPLRNVGKPKDQIITLINEEWQREEEPEMPTADPEAFSTRVSAALQKARESGLPPKGSSKVAQVSREGQQFVRDPEIVAWVLNEANGVCEACGCDAPFVRSDGTPYLEVHHVRWLAESGPDTTDNAIALCPNCHRRLHSSNDRVAFRREVISRVVRIKEYPKKAPPEKTTSD